VKAKKKKSTSLRKALHRGHKTVRTHVESAGSRSAAAKERAVKRSSLSKRYAQRESVWGSRNGRTNPVSASWVEARWINDASLAGED